MSNPCFMYLCFLQLVNFYFLLCTLTFGKTLFSWFIICIIQQKVGVISFS